MKNLLIKLQNKRKEEKGFTLVELLVVIAILAILASVSVVGYMGFTQKAKDSNAVTELTQVKTILTANLLDGKNVDYKYDTTSDQLYVANTKKENVNFKDDFAELANLKGTYTYTFDSAAINDVNNVYNTMWMMTKVVYTLTDGGSATWTLGTSGSIVAGTK